MGKITMQRKDGANIISLDLYANLLSNGDLYEGYVENCGYAFMKMFLFQLKIIRI